MLIMNEAGGIASNSAQLVLCKSVQCVYSLLIMHVISNTVLYYGILQLDSIIMKHIPIRILSCMKYLHPFCQNSSNSVIRTITK